MPRIYTQWSFLDFKSPEVPQSPVIGHPLTENSWPRGRGANTTFMLLLVLVYIGFKSVLCSFCPFYVCPTSRAMWNKQ